MSEANHLPTPAQRLTEPQVNGRASLRDRVQSLRLRADAPVRPRSSWLPWGLTAIALATAVVFGWRSYLITPAEGAPTADPGTNGTPTTANPGGKAPVITGDVVLDAKGYVIAAHQIQLSPQVGGQIVWLDDRFQEGAVYEKGKPLAKVDPIIYQARADSAKAALDVARVNLREVQASGSAVREIESARAQLKNMAAKLELARIDERNKRQAGIGTSRDDLEKAVAQVLADQAAHEAQKENLEKLLVSLRERVEVADAQVNKAQADLQEAEKNLKECIIVAPTTGIILTKKAENGGYVNPLAFGNVAGYLCEMADLRDLEVELDIQERDISRVFKGQRCRIMPEAGQKDDAFLKTHPHGYDGVVSRRMPMANRSKGAVTVRVKIEIPSEEMGGEHLLPDMGVLVSFLKK